MACLQKYIFKIDTPRPFFVWCIFNKTQCTISFPLTVSSVQCIIFEIYIKPQLGWHLVAAVQHTFTHKQYTECRERNIHNNKQIKRT
jgi:hypothetical protein